MNIDNILKQILYKSTVYKELGVTANKIECWKNRFKNGKLSHEKKEEILRLAGYVKVKDAVYEQVVTTVPLSHSEKGNPFF